SPPEPSLPATPPPAAARSEPVRPVATPPTGPVAATASAAAPRPIVAREALPDDVRRRLPELRIGGSMHSPVPANRLLIVDGQVVREGDTVAPGLVIEQIRPRSAVFRFGTHRYEVPL
ncbi:general secretion pathway protein GspB, partial [Ideonella sp. A 288]|uniref:general secretion pathway protein GspB n=1 Tax=Ideonella sp. A 288 TaxID=1962181 RepID=UPI001F372EC8